MLQIVSSATVSLAPTFICSLFECWHAVLRFVGYVVQGRQSGPAESGALIGNDNPEADAAAANGPRPSQGRGSHVQHNGTANGSQSAADSSVEGMENGEAGPESKKSIVAQPGKSK